MYGNFWDSHLYTMIKSRKDVGTGMTTGELGAKLTEIEEAATETYGEENKEDKEILKDASDDDADPDIIDGNADLDDCAAVKDIEKKCKADDEKLEKLAHYKAACRRLVATHVELIPETEPDDKLIAAMQRSVAGQLRGDASKKTVSYTHLTLPTKA